MKLRLVPVFSAIVLCAGPAAAGEVPSWRNGGNGLYPEARAALDWTKPSVVVWETPMPARSNGSPILVDGRIFVTAEPSTLVCVDADTGRILWERPNEPSDLVEMSAEERAEMEAAKARAEEIGEKTRPLERELYRAERRLRRDRDDEQLKTRVEALKAEIAELRKGLGPLAAGMERPSAHDVNGYSSYTPVSDGERVWACFGTAVVVCFDLEGNRLWHRRTDKPDHAWGGSSSPTLVDGKLILRYSDYVALDPASGEELWRTPSEGTTFNAPASFELEGEHFLVTNRGELIRAGDGGKLPSKGYKVDAKPWCFFHTPSVVGNRIYLAFGCEGEQGDAYCLEIPSSVAALEKEGLKQVWHTEVDRNRYYSSPLVHEGVVHLISREYQFQALDAATGERFFDEKIRGFTGTAYPSLTLAGGEIFVGAEDGNIAFVKPGREFAEIRRTKVEPFRSTPVFDGATAFLRTQESLRAVRADGSGPRELAPGGN